MRCVPHFLHPCPRRYLRGGCAERLFYVQLFLAAAPPLWELASPAQLLRSKLFSRFVRTQARPLHCCGAARREGVA